MVLQVWVAGVKIRRLLKQEGVNPQVENTYALTASADGDFMTGLSEIKGLALLLLLLEVGFWLFVAYCIIKRQKRTRPKQP